jgi:hypothetical protein
MEKIREAAGRVPSSQAAIAPTNPISSARVRRTQKLATPAIASRSRVARAAAAPARSSQARACSRGP